MTYQQSRANILWERDCSGLSSETGPCSTDCERCQNILKVRPFIASFLGSNGYESGEKNKGSVTGWLLNIFRP